MNRVHRFTFTISFPVLCSCFAAITIAQTPTAVAVTGGHKATRQEAKKIRRIRLLPNPRTATGRNDGPIRTIHAPN
jgi:hypothetical protein